MSISWYRVDSAASPTGHELRAKSRGKTWRTYKTASGTWKVGPVGASPHQTKTCRTLEDARRYAEQGLAANPPTSSRPQEIHMLATQTRSTKTASRSKNPIACGDLTARKCRQLRHVYKSARSQGYSAQRSAKQAWGAVEKSRNPTPMPKAVSDFFRGLEQNPRRRRKRRRNAETKGHAGLGAFIGSIVGSAAGLAVDSYSLASLGNVVGAGVGGHIGAAPDRKRRGTWGGVIGSVLLGPIGAGIGGWISGKRPDA